MTARERASLFAMMVLTLSINIVLAISILLNRASIERSNNEIVKFNQNIKEFRERGERFTFCDGLILYRLAVKEELSDAFCVDDTDFATFLRDNGVDVK